MRKLLAVMIVAALCAASSRLFAGVVMTQETISNPAGSPIRENRTLMIQGHRQKMITSGQTIVIDLDKGTMTLINPAAKTYSVMPFPPRGQMASKMQNAGAVNMAFEKTGVTKTVSGYNCTEYTSSGRNMMGEYTVKGCFSPTAPGAGEYDEFTRELSKKFKGMGMAKVEGKHPEGVPLALETTTRMTGFSMPGMPPDQAEKIRQMMASRPPATSQSTTTSIKTADLPADTFETPTGYQKREMPTLTGASRMGGPMARPTPYEGE